MFKIDRRNNILISNGDNAILDVSICGETLKEGDTIYFECTEQSHTITTFVDGVAKIHLEKRNEDHNGYYSMRAIMKDGRDCLVAQGKYVRKGLI